MASQQPSQRDDHRAALTPPGVARYAATVTVALAAATTASTFLPWASSGERARSSYALVEVADRAGILPSSTAAVAHAWLLVPALCGVALLAYSVRSVVTASLAAVILGAVVVAGGVLVTRSPLAIEPGAVVSMLGGALTVLSGVTTLSTRRSQGGNR